MNHTPEPANQQRPAGEYAHALPKPAIQCGWCISTHIADIRCTCEEPCMDKSGKPVGWCAKAEQGDPFEVKFL
jgi:hypothetical protein